MGERIAAQTSKRYCPHKGRRETHLDRVLVGVPRELLIQELVELNHLNDWPEYRTMYLMVGQSLIQGLH